MVLFEIPVGVKFIQFFSNSCPGREYNRHLICRTSVLILTFLTYACYHASRKPLSVVKSYFGRKCDGLVPPTGTDLNDTTWCDWAPFYGSDGSVLLGVLDSSFLFSYAGAMFLSGFVAERVNLRYFLAIGMISSGVAGYLFGVAHRFDIHSLWYYIAVQIFGGIVQTTGWPGVVAVMGNWYGKGNRGLIFGLWNSHTSVGNIVGALVASSLLQRDWAFSFMIPSVMIAGMGFINFLFLIDSPESVGLDKPDTFLKESHCDASTNPIDTKSINSNSGSNKEKAIGIIGALKIPGVIEFSMCLFFSKLVNYTFLYWLPFYINSSSSYSETLSADLSTIFDVGGILGGIFAGAVSDYTGMSALTCTIMLIFAVPLLFLYNLFGSINLWLNIGMLALAGFFVNGPYALITTAVSADLGTHKTLSTNSKALATVTAIIDGTGSLGAAVGPLLAGVVYTYGWQNVFYMLMASNVLALVAILRLVFKELRLSCGSSASGSTV
ncbi:unnamed protein product [Nezara viridula]|uniref:Sugar phosphate exchanger 3 n=1 Tax=Nezara viridula TaxID=85310 RepID=A0A9P0H4Q3_NEZVI|nr:unnamed protein product [Nezara viridula]